MQALLLLVMCCLQIYSSSVLAVLPPTMKSFPATARLPMNFRESRWAKKINTYSIPHTPSLFKIKGGALRDDYDDYDSLDNAALSSPVVLIGKIKHLLAPLLTIISKTPPITRIYLTTSFLCTLFSFLLLGNRFPKTLLLDWPSVMKLQLWRPLTSFLYFGPFGVSFLLTIQFLWQYMSQVEKLHYARPEKFVMLMAFGCVSLLVSYMFLGISTQFLGHNLSTYLVYIWSKMFEGMSVNMMGLVTLSAEMLPWFFCAQTLVVDGLFPTADLLGILIGHMYIYFEKKQLLEPPDALTEVFARKGIRREYLKFKGDFE
jgi:Derlin-2/3